MTPRIRVFLYAEILCLLIATAFFFLLGLFPKSAFDDVFMKNNRLLPYIDFRPGYPPLGKLPYYFLNLSFADTIYSAYAFLFNLFSLLFMCLILYLCISKLAPNKAFTLALSILALPSVLYFTLIYAKADAFAMFFVLLALYFIENPWKCGIMCGIGALVKFHPALLLIPLLVRFKPKKGAKLLYSFSSVVLLVSFPFLFWDPLMYASTYVGYFSRGPAESIFAVIDGYFGHTGFMHPTFDATIYSWQGSFPYSPSPLDHFSYKWSIPVLPYLSLTLQIASLITLSWFAKNRKDPKESVMLISLAMFSYFAFSTFYNPAIQVILIPYLILATLHWRKSLQIAMIAAFEVVNIVHSLLWFAPLFLNIGTMLPLSITITTRTALYGVVFLIFVWRRKI